MSKRPQRLRPRSPVKTLLVHALARYAQSGSALILTYHRISVPAVFDPFDLRVSPERFGAQLAYLKTHYQVVPLAEMVRQVCEGRFVAPGQVAITFDDGYADNVHCALPALQRAGVPATFLVTTGYVDSTKWFWWDELGAIAQEAAGLRTSYHKLYRALRVLPDEERRTQMDQLRQELGVEGKPSPEDRPLRWAEVRALVAAGHEVGSHTVTHPVLSVLSPAQVEAEFLDSKQVIEAHTGHSVTALAYPYGRPETIGEIAVQAARSAGYQCGLTTISRTIRRGSDPFRLGRFHVKDWDRSDFAYELARCFASLAWPLRRGHG